MEALAGDDAAQRNVRIYDFSLYASVNVMPLGGGGGGSGRELGFDIFLKFFVKVHSLRTKSLVKKPKNPHRGANPSIIFIYFNLFIYLLTLIQKSTLGKYKCIQHTSKDEKIQHFVKLKAFNNNKCKQARAKILLHL